MRRTAIHQKTHRLIASRYPTVGVFDDVANPDDLEALMLLEGWTNDRISSELGILHHLPKEKWVCGKPGANFIMAAYCHPGHTGSRFNDARIGAWYASFDIETAIRETVHHHTLKLQMADNFFTASIQMRELCSTLKAEFVDICGQASKLPELYHDSNYEKSQSFAEQHRAANENGILYSSIRKEKGVNVVVFNPHVLPPVSQGAHFEYRWHGKPEPEVFKLKLL